MSIHSELRNRCIVAAAAAAAVAIVPHVDFSVHPRARLFSLWLWLVNVNEHERRINGDDEQSAQKPPNQWLKIKYEHKRLRFRISLVPIAEFLWRTNHHQHIHSMKNCYTFGTARNRKEGNRNSEITIRWKQTPQHFKNKRRKEKKLIVYVNKRDWDMQFCIIIVMYDYSCNHRDVAVCVFVWYNLIRLSFIPFHSLLARSSSTLKIDLKWLPPMCCVHVSLICSACHEIYCVNHSVANANWLDVTHILWACQRKRERNVHAAVQMKWQRSRQKG